MTLLLPAIALAAFSLNFLFAFLVNYPVLLVAVAYHSTLTWLVLAPFAIYRRHEDSRLVRRGFWILLIPMTLVFLFLTAEFSLGAPL